MSDSPRCKECDAPMIVIDHWWVCGYIECSKFHIRAIREGDPDE